MSSRHFVSIFLDEDSTFGAVLELRKEGFKIREVYAPYAVHGLDRAAGLPRSRIGFVTVTAAAIGSLAFYFFQDWVHAVDWPLNIGGKPYSSAPAWIPVVFETGVLFAGLATVLALFVRSGLYPGKKAKLIDPRITDDHFAVVLYILDSGFDTDQVLRICNRHGAGAAEEIEVPSKNVKRPTSDIATLEVWR